MSEQNFELLKFFPLVKVDKVTHTVYGLATCEEVDKDLEICDYDGAKKAYQEWAEEAQSSTTAAGQDVSLGNIRYMHTAKIVAGKATKIKFDDTRKQVWLESVPAPPVAKDDIDVWPLLEGGFLRGYSQGGRYISRVCNECRKDISGRFCQHCNKNVVVRYVPSISEVSYVDNPCLKQATFIFVKEDGSAELRKFKKEDIPTTEGALPTTPTSVEDVPQGDEDLAAEGSVPPSERQCSCSCAECAKGDHAGCTASEKCMAAAAKAVIPDDFNKKEKKQPGVKYLVPDSQDGYLPYTKADGKCDSDLMCASWSALFSPSGHKGNKYTGPKKELAKRKLKALFRREKMETPAQKLAKTELQKEEKVRKTIENLLVDTINNRAYGQLNKGMYTVSRFADLIESLKYLWLSMEWEEEEEGDESPATEDVMNAYMSLLDALVAYTEEQVQEAKQHPLIAEAVEVIEVIEVVG